jgi:DNA polymerase delta subunit 2
MLGTSGQPLSDMHRYLPDPEDGSSLRLSLLKTTLACRHMAPTAPDTLHCFPYFGTDPFILTHTPSLYFHGTYFYAVPLLFEFTNGVH